jgi:hypothetical protein
MIAGSYHTAAATVHTGAGLLLALLISHSQATVQTVTLYDNTAASGTVLLAVDVEPTRSPIYLRFPRNLAPAFSTGLHVVPGNCKVALWGIGA